MKMVPFLLTALLLVLASSMKCLALTIRLVLVFAAVAMAPSLRPGRKTTGDTRGGTTASTVRRADQQGGPGSGCLHAVGRRRGGLRAHVG